MKQIQTVSIVGLGALGILFGHHLEKRLPEGDLRIVADRPRIERYTRDGVYSNGEPCRFCYVTPEEDTGPADLLLFTVKYGGLADAIEAARRQVGPNTVILSLLNGISSEEIIRHAYDAGTVLYSVAQGMDAVKVGNALTYHHMGLICYGPRTTGEDADAVEAVREFFTRTGVPFLVDPDMRRRLWGKFMLNVGVNQAVAVFECDYGGILQKGPARDTMIAAMEEVLTLSEYEGVHLTREDLNYWLRVLEGLDHRGKPSMRQDLEAGRRSEVELFSGTVLALAQKHGLQCPVNQMLYDKIREMEAAFN